MQHAALVSKTKGFKAGDRLFCGIFITKIRHYVPIKYSKIEGQYLKTYAKRSFEQSEIRIIVNSRINI